MTVDKFSERFGYRQPDADIAIREEAPEEVRIGLVQLAYDMHLAPGAVRETVCKVLLKRPDPSNWSDENIRREVDWLIDEASWFKVYDVAEALYLELGRTLHTTARQANFERRLNRLFSQLGVEWRMDRGALMARGSEAFTLATAHAVETMRSSGAPTASNEIHEALVDISRRPQADVTGSIQHAMAALECVAREVDGSADTLGQIIGRLALPKPLDEALHKLWGFASEQGRHIREGREPRFEEAELVVTVAAAVSLYLLNPRQRG